MYLAGGTIAGRPKWRTKPQQRSKMRTQQACPIATASSPQSSTSCMKTKHNIFLCLMAELLILVSEQNLTLKNVRNC